ncbi:MAG: hypothetical protein ACE5I1_06315, partial [bacterium]
MPRSLSIDQIIEATLCGIELSQKKYENWSGGCWLWEAPEYLITINVAENIAKLSGSKYLTLEHSAKYALEDAGAKTRGRLPHDIRELGRVDILLWWANETPRAIIEIKNQIYTTDQYSRDIKRIKEFLKRKQTSSSIQFGLFAFYDSAYDGARKTAVEKIQDKIKTVKGNIREILGDAFYISVKKSKIHQVNGDAWVAGCVFIRLKS